MAVTTLLGNTYPDENQDPWWTTIRSFFLAEDEWLQANYEDKSLLVFGGGTMTLIGSTFSWSAPLYIVSQRSVTKITVSASSLTVADGEVIFVTTGGRPITNQTLTLQAGSPVTKNDIPIGYRDGATVHIKDLTFLSGYELDDAYNASSGAADVSVDAGDVTWDTVGAYSFNVDLSLTTGTADGFHVIDGTDYLRLIHKTTNALDLESELRNIDFNSSGTIDLDAVGTLRVDSDGGTIIHGANVTVEADGGILAITGDGAADIDISNVGAGIDIDSATLLVDTTAGISIDGAGASNFTIDGANLTIATTTSGTLAIDAVALLDINAATFDVDTTGAITIDTAAGISIDAATASNFTVDGANLTIATTTSGTLTIDAVATLDVNAATFDVDTTGAITIDTAAGISIDAATASNFTVSGATADLTLGARAATITLNEAGQTTLNGGFTATSIIGAINENYGAIAATTLDVAYNNDGGAAGITVDAGDVTWSPTGDYSFIVDLTSTTNAADGFFVENGTDYFRLTRAGANDITLATQTSTATWDCSAGFSLDAATASNVTVSGATADLTLGARSTTITLNEVGQTSLSGGFAATSIIGAINENASDIAATTLDVAYNNDGGAAAITVDAGDIQWSPTGAYSFIIKMAGITGLTTVDGFIVENGTDQFSLLHSHEGANLLVLDADLYSATIDCSGGISIDVATASNFTVSGATADLTLGARSTTITLNEAGQTSLSGGFAATSIIGAINENATDIAATTLDVAYNNDGGAASITIDAGDVTWSPTGDYSFIVDLAATTNAADGFSVVNGSDQFDLIRKNANLIDLDADLQAVDIDASTTIAIDAVSTIEWSGTNASLTSAGALAIASDFTLTGGGSILSTANSNILLTPNGTGITVIGTGAGSHTLNTSGSLYVSDELEVDGTLYCDGTLSTAGSVTMGAGQQLFSNSVVAGGIQLRNTIQTVDCMVMAIGADCNYLMVCQQGDIAYDFAHTQQIDPTIFIQSANQSATEYVGLNHNQTDAKKVIGAGSRVTEHITPVNLADDAEFGLPDATSGYGTFVIGDSEEYAQIVWDSAGVVDLLTNSANVVNTDTDTKMCFYDSGTQVMVKNRLGAAKKIKFEYYYDTP